MNNAEQTITPIVDSPREIGIQAADRQNIAERLSEILAGTYGLLIKTQIIHWNTHGMRFFEIHKLTEAQYNTLFAAIDVIAERVLVLGFNIPLRADHLLSREDLSFDPAMTTDDMLEWLATGHEASARAVRETADMADSASDRVSGDMLNARLAEHEMAVWMLRAQKQRTDSAAGSNGSKAGQKR